MMRSLIGLLVLVVLLTSCDERKEEFRESFLAGRLLYSHPDDPFREVLPLGGKTVKLASVPSDTLNYSSSVRTDAEGYFLFQNLAAGQYLVFFEDSVDHLLYKGQATAWTNNDTLRITAMPDTTAHNGYRLLVQDAAGEPVPGATVCVFNNAAAWNADTCKGSLYTLPLSNEGTAVRRKVVPDDYYFLGTAVINNQFYRGKVQTNVKAAGMTPVVLQLHPVADTTSGFVLTVRDPSRAPVNDVQVCVFSSYSFFKADTCLGQVYNLETDERGRTSKLHIAEGRYYLRANIELGDTRLKALDSVDVIKGKITEKTVDLIKR